MSTRCASNSSISGGSGERSDGERLCKGQLGKIDLAHLFEQVYASAVGFDGSEVGGDFQPLVLKLDAEKILLGNGPGTEARGVEIDGPLKRVHRRFENAADLLCTASRPVSQSHALGNVPFRHLQTGGGQRDIFVSSRNSCLPLTKDVERLVDERESIDIAGVSLARPQVLVLELEFGIGKQSGLFSQTLGRRNSFGFRFQRGARLQRSIYGVVRLSRSLGQARPRDQTIRTALKRPFFSQNSFNSDTEKRVPRRRDTPGLAKPATGFVGRKRSERRGARSGVFEGGGIVRPFLDGGYRSGCFSRFDRNGRGSGRQIQREAAGQYQRECIERLRMRMIVIVVCLDMNSGRGMHNGVGEKEMRVDLPGFRVVPIGTRMDMLERCKKESQQECQKLVSDRYRATHHQILQEDYACNPEG